MQQSRQGSFNADDAGAPIMMDNLGSGSGSSSSLEPDSSTINEGTATPSQLQFIVQELNKILNTNYSLVSFDSKKGRDLLQVLNDVLAYLSPTMTMDLSTEDPQLTGQRIVDFLCNILNYKVTDSRSRVLDILTYYHICSSVTVELFNGVL